MATEYPITVSEIRDGFSTGVSDSDLTGLIAMSDQADSCLRNNEVDQNLGQTLKRLFVRHMAVMSRDGGAVRSERAVSGASRGYVDMYEGETGFLNTLKRLDRWGCVYGLASNNQPIQLRTAGRNVCNPRTW